MAPALTDRLVLLLNHVLQREPAATQRLLPHEGRVLRVEFAGWPQILPPPPALSLRITPAGLVEACAGDAPTDLRVRLAATDPASLALAALSGAAPPLDIDGDAQLAADIDWLAKNLRWDVGADLERIFGPAPAHELERLGRMIAGGLKSAIEAAASLTGRSRRP